MTDEEQPDSYQTLTAFLEENANGEDVLETLLDADSTHETWEFDDVALDSGTFGEVVSRGIVEKSDGAYHLANSDAVRAVLSDEQREQQTTEQGDSFDFEGIRETARSFVSVRTGLLSLILLTIALVRMVFHYQGVFRDGRVVLAGNDPYRRRYWLERLVESDLQPWNPLDLASMPEFVTTTDTFFYWLMWLFSALFGNSVESVGLVLAWYPVVAAMLTGLVVYLLALRLTGDYRVGIASAFMLAIIPIHASYTGLGMGDHHPLDYLLLTMVIGLLVVIVDEKETVSIARRDVSATRTGIVGLGATLAALNAAWKGTPLWFAGVGVYVVAQSALDYHRGNSPSTRGVPILAGTVLAAIFTLVLHFGLNWLQPYRMLTPMLLVAGVGAVLAAGEVGYRLDIPSKTGLPLSAAVGSVVVALAWIFVPPFSENVNDFWGYLNRTASGNITETASLFTPELGVYGGPMSYIAVPFVFAFPVLIWLTWRGIRGSDAGLLVVTTFGWYLFGWATVQIRFTAELAPLLALFAGIGFVWVLSWVDLLAAPDWLADSEVDSAHSSSSEFPLPDISSTQIAYVAVIALAFAAFSLIFVSSFAADTAVEDKTYQTAKWLEQYSEERGYEYPENYVFSPWGVNRQYNYYVSGESDTYTFAQRNYEDFINSQDPDEWYDRLSENGRFIVTHDHEVAENSSVVQATLHERFGSRGESTAGASHYRALYTTPGQERVAFELVPGARMTGVAEPDETYTVETDVEIGGTSFTYERQVQTNRYGDYGLTVPYAGTYEIASEDWEVHQDSIQSEIVLGSYRSHWAFDEGEDTIRDPVGGDTAAVDNASWVDGVGGSALQFDGDGSTVVRDHAAQGIANESFTVSFWIRGDLTESDASFPTALYREGTQGSGYGFWARAGGENSDFGVRVDDTQNNDVRAFGIETARFEEWTMITAVVDREQAEIRLYRNGSLATAVDAARLGPVADDGQLAIGGRPGSQYSTARLDSIRVYATALDAAEIDSLATNPSGSDLP